MSTKTTATLYGVTNGNTETIIGDLVPDVETARRHATYLTEQAVPFGIDFTARVVTVEATTNYGRPHVYKDPEVEVLPPVDTTAPVVEDPAPTE